MATLMGPVDDRVAEGASAVWSGLDLLDSLGALGLVLALVVLCAAVVTAGLHGGRRRRV